MIRGNYNSAELSKRPQVSSYSRNLNKTTDRTFVFIPFSLMISSTWQLKPCHLRRQNNGIGLVEAPLLLSRLENIATVVYQPKGLLNRATSGRCSSMSKMKCFCREFRTLDGVEPDRSVQQSSSKEIERK